MDMVKDVSGLISKLAEFVSQSKPHDAKDIEFVEGGEIRATFSATLGENKKLQLEVKEELTSFVKKTEGRTSQLGMFAPQPFNVQRTLDQIARDIPKACPGATVSFTSGPRREFG